MWGVYNYNDNLNYYVRGKYHEVNKYASSAFYKKIISGKTYPALYRMLSSQSDWQHSQRKGKPSYIFDKKVGDIVTFKQLTSTTSRKPDMEFIQDFMDDTWDEEIDTIVVLKNAKGLPVDYNNKMVMNSGFAIPIDRFDYQEEVITFGKFRIDKIYNDPDICPGFDTTIYECSTIDQSRELAFNIQKDKYQKIKNNTYDIYESKIKESYKDFDAETISSYVKGFVRHIKEYEDVAEFLEDLNEYLEPLQVEVCPEGFRSSQYKWVTPNIAFASMNAAGCISIEIGAEQLLDDLIWDRENNYPYEEDSDFNQFLKELGQVVVHECVHAHQFSRGYPGKVWADSGDPGVVGMYDYLASKDEIDAHAIAGVQEALDMGYTKEDILDILSGKGKYSSAQDLICELNSTTDYYDWFGCSDDPRDLKVLRRLYKVMANELLK